MNALTEAQANEALARERVIEAVEAVIGTVLDGSHPLWPLLSAWRDAIEERTRWEDEREFNSRARTFATAQDVESAYETGLLRGRYGRR